MRETWGICFSRIGFPSPWFVHMSSVFYNTGWLFDICGMKYYPIKNGDYFRSQYKDPYKLISRMGCHRGLVHAAHMTFKSKVGCTLIDEQRALVRIWEDSFSNSGFFSQTQVFFSQTQGLSKP